jgi:hypothetical protein
MVDFVAVNHQIADRNPGVRTVDADTQTVTSRFRPHQSREVLLDLMNVVVENFNVGTATGYANSPRQTPEVSPEAAQEYTACSQPAEGA